MDWAFSIPAAEAEWAAGWADSLARSLRLAGDEAAAAESRRIAGENAAHAAGVLGLYGSELDGRLTAAALAAG